MTSQRWSDLQRGWGFPTSLSGHCAAWVIKPAGEARAEPVVGLGNPVESPRPCARSTARGGGSPTYRLAASRLLLLPHRCNVADLGMCARDRSLTMDRRSRAREPPCPKGESRPAARMSNPQQKNLRRRRADHAEGGQSACRDLLMAFCFIAGSVPPARPRSLVMV
jgi:hypothetical protein